MQGYEYTSLDIGAEVIRLTRTEYLLESLE